MATPGLVHQPSIAESRIEGRRAWVDAIPAAPPIPTDAPQIHAQLSANGALLLTGCTAEQPDRGLGALQTAPPDNWQWLPYCGADFPFETYAQRGPLIAWLPPRLDLAVLLTRPRPEAAPVPPSRPPRQPV